VVDVQATDEGAAAVALAESADAALRAVEVNRARLTDATESVRRLRRLRTPVLGAIVFPTPRGPFRPKSARPAEGRVVAGKGGPGRADTPAAQRAGEPSPPPPAPSAEGAHPRGGAAPGPRPLRRPRRQRPRNRG